MLLRMSLSERSRWMTKTYISNMLMPRMVAVADTPISNTIMRARVHRRGGVAGIN